MNPALVNLIQKYPDLEPCKSDLQKSLQFLKATYQNQGKLLICGNGGSAADCEHIVGELMKGFVSKRPLSGEERASFKKIFPEEGEYLADHLQGALPAISLVSHSALISAFTNDVSAETVFAQQVYGYGQASDVLLAISTSGNSINIIRAVQVARIKGVTTIGLSGKDGGRLKELCDVTIVVPRDNTAAIQELHLPIYHALCVALENEFFPSSQRTFAKEKASLAG
ncbi:MAG: SIS domain-containing protein [Cyclobacteriaceae bacterium]